MNMLSIISFGISIISIIGTITVIVFMFLRKFKQKTEQNDKISIFWTIPFIILILLSIGLIGATIGMNEMKDENMDKIVKDIKSIIESARQRLNAVNLERYDGTITTFVPELKKKLRVDTKYQQLQDYQYRTEMRIVNKKADEFEKWIRTLKVNACTQGHMLLEPDQMVAKYTELRNEARAFYDNQAMPISKKIDNKFYRNFMAEEEKWLKKNYGKWKVEKGVELRKKILDNFEKDMNNVPMTRRKWIEKMDEKLSAKKGTIEKCIIIPCSILILLSMISILFIVFGSKRIPLSSICKPTILLIAGLCSIITSIVLIIVSLGISEKCSLNEHNFGLQDFLTPIPGNESLSICQSPESSFYSDLGNDTVVTFEDVERALEIPKHRDMIRTEFLSYMHMLTFHQEYYDIKKSVDQTVGKLTKACNSNCFPNDAGQLCNYTNLIKEGQLVLTKIESMAARFNTFYQSPERDQIIDNVIDFYFSLVFMELSTEHINQTQKEVVASDFSCDPLIEKFTQTGRSICDQLDFLIPILHILLTIVPVSFSAYLVLNVLIFKYSFNVKQNNKLSSGNNPSQSPALTSTNV